MAKKHNKPTLDESEYFDEIQAQVTELMGPPPLQTTPSSENQKTIPVVEKIEKPKPVAREATNDLNKLDVPKSTVPVPPKQEVVKKNKQTTSEISEEKINNPLEEKTESDDITADKSITIEQAQELSKQKEQAHNDITPDNSDSIYSNKVSTAVEDIEARESNTTADSKPDTTKNKIKSKKSNKKFNLKKILIILFTLLAMILVAIFVIPTTRYYLLNNLGVRSSASLMVVDSKTNFPISGVKVSVQGQEYTSNDAGKVMASNLKLGKTTILFQKRSFGEQRQTVIIGWGSNPINKPFALEPAGNKYSIYVKDWISKKGIDGAVVISEDSRVTTDKNGLAEITIAESAPKKIKIETTDYREENFDLLEQEQKIEVSLVPASALFFINEEKGTLNLEKVDLDGKNKVTVFGGSGSEIEERISIMAQPSSQRQIAAFVSTRSGIKNSDGYLLSDLYIVEGKKKIANKVIGTTSEKIQLLGWDNNKIIFIKTVSGPSAAQDGRQRIVAYDIDSDTSIEIAKADNFNDSILKGKELVYANNGPSAKLFRVQTDGSNLKTILNKEVWALEEIATTAFLANSSDKKWQKINFTNSNIEELNGAAADSYINKLKLYSPSSTKLAILETGSRSNKLIIRSEKSSSEYNDNRISRNSNIAWISDNYILIQDSVFDGNALIINTESKQVSSVQ